MAAPRVAHGGQLLVACRGGQQLLEQLMADNLWCRLMAATIDTVQGGRLMQRVLVSDTRCLRIAKSTSILAYSEDSAESALCAATRTQYGLQAKD